MFDFIRDHSYPRVQQPSTALAFVIAGLDQEIQAAGPETYEAHDGVGLGIHANSLDTQVEPAQEDSRAASNHNALISNIKYR